MTDSIYLIPPLAVVLDDLRVSMAIKTDPPAVNKIDPPVIVS